MRLDRRPLLETAVDADLFVDRERELDRMLRALDLELNVAVGGPDGSGRTTVLRRLVFRLRALDRPVVFVGASGADSPQELLTRVLRRVAGDDAAAAAAYAGSDAHALLGRISAVLPDAVRSDAVLSDARLPDGGARPVVVLDDLALEPGRALFGTLRDEVWRLPVSWTVAPTGELAALLQPPVDAFFEVTVELEGLDPDVLVELLRRRLDDPLPEADLRRLAELGGGSPRRTVDLARSVVLDGTSVDMLVAEARRRADRLARLSEPAATLARLLESLGPVSPSDVDLQRRMGVSRPRLVALFGELRDVGLVEELPPDRSSGGPGRPRLRYALATPAHSVGAETVGAETVGPVRDAADDDR